MGRERRKASFTIDEAEGERRQLTEDEKLDWLRLSRTENVGPVSFRQLLAHFGSARAALEAVPDLRRRGGMRLPGRIYPQSAAERDMKAARKAGLHIIALPEAEYPALLKHIESAPPLLYAKGRLELAMGDCIAIVGSRAASAAGLQFAGHLARDLGGHDLVITSGLARGIDTAAHKAALPSGTIAVLAGGLDVVYPPENAGLHAAIAESGLLISEYPLDFSPRGQDFPRRNRIISGISLGAVIVEATQQSGSLITARMALEQNRELFAVPGHPLDPRSSGTNQLLRDGAHLTRSSDDVIAELQLGLRPAMFREALSPIFPQEMPAIGFEPTELSVSDREKIISALGITPIDTDILVRNIDISPRHLSVALLELELAGRIERHGNRHVSLRLSETSH